MDDGDDANIAYRMLKTNRRISTVNYIRSLAKCSRVMKEFIKNSKKTSISKDLNDLINKKARNKQEESIIKFSLSQKKILFNHIKLFNVRLVKEFETEIFSNLKNKYI